MYFLSDFLRQNKIRTTYGDEVPLTTVKNNDYYKISTELEVFSWQNEAQEKE